MASLTDSTQYTGRVKWFNKKAGYGFVTITDGDKSGEDVFVHHSGVRVTTEQFKYLVQGEYVMFTLTETESDKHTIQAWDIRGINGGMLMCETLNEIRESRQQHSDHQTTEGSTREHGTERGRGRRYVRGRNTEGHGRRNVQHRNFDDGPREGEEWLLVRRTDKSNTQTSRPTNDQYSNDQ